MEATGVLCAKAVLQGAQAGSPTQRRNVGSARVPADQRDIVVNCLVSYTFWCSINSLPCVLHQHKKTICFLFFFFALSWRHVPSDAVGERLRVPVVVQGQRSGTVLQDAQSLRSRWHGNAHLAIKPAGPSQRRVDGVWAVGGGNDDQLATRLEGHPSGSVAGPQPGSRTFTITTIKQRKV
jgi:hypothetical protein